MRFVALMLGFDSESFARQQNTFQSEVPANFLSNSSNMNLVHDKYIFFTFLIVWFVLVTDNAVFV